MMVMINLFILRRNIAKCAV